MILHLRYFLIFFMLGIVLPAFSQQTIKVVDAKTGLPLAFVNIRYDKGKSGCSTDIKGKFILDANVKHLELTYVGYSDTSMLVETLMKRRPYQVRMKSEQYALKEVIIIPGINPAHRIIQHTIDRRKDNNPEKLASFSYKAYHKMVFTADSQQVQTPDTLLRNSLDSTQVDTARVDSSEVEMRQFLERQHLFMMESVSERKFLKPDRSTAKILGTRVSGMQAPMFAMMATQFQSFSFYNPMVQVAGRDYVNPISKGSTKKYFFRIEDTLYEAADTVFIIAFRPLWGKNFEGLKGVLYIHSADWAIKSVIAEPYEQNKSVDIRVEQLYQKIDSAWFPIQLNTRLLFPNIILNKSALIGIGHTYLDEIKINPKLRARQFDHVVIEIDAEAGHKKDEFWNEYREDSLSVREQMTYQVMDSIGKEANVERWVKVSKILSQGQIPIWKFSLDLDKFYHVNLYEKSRWGLGIRTNDRMLPWLTLRGYGAYGVGDKKWKYGGGVDLMINKYYDWGFHFDYKNDLEESAHQTMFGNWNFLTTDFARNMLIEKMVHVESFEARMHFRALKHFRYEFGARHASYYNTDDYLFNVFGDEVKIWSSDFAVAEASLGIRFGYKEKFMARASKLISLGTKYPILNLKFTQGISGIQQSAFDYQKLDAQLDYSFKLRYIGKTSLRFNAGKVTDDLPWYLLYNGRGSYAKVYIDAPNTFNTMRMNEFLSDEYAAVYLRHNFGNLLYKTEHFAPEVLVASSAIFGSLSSNDRHKNIDYKTLEKGYYESGLILKNLYTSLITSLGFGVYYRYGPYALEKQEDNFTYKITIGFVF